MTLLTELQTLQRHLKNGKTGLKTYIHSNAKTFKDFKDRSVRTRLRGYIVKNVDRE